MKRILFFAVTGSLLLCLTAFNSTKKFSDIFKQLAIENTEAREYIFSNFEQGTLSFPHSSVLTKLALGKREAAVREIGDFIKSYTASPEFAESYHAAREAAKPAGAATREEKILARIAEIENDIVTTENDMKDKQGDMKKLYEASLLELKKELKALKNVNDPAHNYYVKEATEAHSSSIDMAAEDLKYWEEEYPLSVNELVKRRLIAFLEFTKDIDFNARLVKRGNKMIFADPVLENKDATWKCCFRCGKETIMAARSYAQQWLATLK